MENTTFHCGKKKDAYGIKYLNIRELVIRIGMKDVHWGADILKKP
jgi:hypothetical protein